MHAHRFDRWVRALHRHLSRRSLIRGAASLLTAGAITGLAGSRRAAAEVRLAALCDANGNAVFTASNVNVGVAQTFVAEKSGKLSRVRIFLQQQPDTEGDYVVKLLAVDENGVPTTEVLAKAKKILNADVPVGDFVGVNAFFRRDNTFKLVQGDRYAIQVSRPGGTKLNVRNNNADGCGADQQMFEGTSEEPNVDMLFKAFVGFS